MNESTRSTTRRPRHGAVAERDDGRRDRARDHARRRAPAGWCAASPACATPTSGSSADKRLIFDVSFLGPKYPNPATRCDTAARTLIERLSRAAGRDRRSARRRTSRCGTRTRARSSRSSTASRSIRRIRSARGSASSARATSRRPARGCSQGRDFGPDDRREHAPGRDHQPGVREALSQRRAIRSACSSRPAIRRPIRATKSPSSASSTTSGRRASATTRSRRSTRRSRSSRCAVRRWSWPRQRTTWRRCSRRSAREVRQFDPQIAVEFELVTDLVAGTFRRQQLGMTLMLIFGGGRHPARRGRHLRRGRVRGVAAARRDGDAPGARRHAGQRVPAGDEAGRAARRWPARRSALPSRICPDGSWRARSTRSARRIRSMLGGAIVARRRDHGAGDDDPGVARVAAEAVRRVARRVGAASYRGRRDCHDEDTQTARRIGESAEGVTARCRRVRVRGAAGQPSCRAFARWTDRGILETNRLASPAACLQDPAVGQSGPAEPARMTDARQLPLRVLGETSAFSARSVVSANSRNRIALECQHLEGLQVERVRQAGAQLHWVDRGIERAVHPVTHRRVCRKFERLLHVNRD